MKAMITAIALAFAVSTVGFAPPVSAETKQTQKEKAKPVSTPSQQMIDKCLKLAHERGIRPKGGYDGPFMRPCLQGKIN